MIVTSIILEDIKISHEVLKLKANKVEGWISSRFLTSEF